MTTLKEADTTQLRMKVHQVVQENLLLEFPEVNREAASKPAFKIVSARTHKQLTALLVDNV